MATRPATGTVTLLFTDLVDSTGVLQRLGEEGAEQFRRTHFRLLREAVAAHNGQEVKNLGDGLMVAFASALDATRCAIAMQQAVERHNRRGGEPLNVRVGLNVGEPIRDEEDYFGTPVVIAQRLCASASGGQVVASELVRALLGTRDSVTFRSLGPRVLKGLTGPLAACEVSWEPVADALALPRLALAGRSPFVGREREVAALETMLAETARGSGRVALIAGEPGIGKSRLLQELSSRARRASWLVLSGRAYDTEGMPPYLPFVEVLRQHVTACPPGDLRTQLGRGAPEVALLVPELLERLPGIEPSPPLSQDERYPLFEGVTGFLLNAASAHPPGLLLAIDDLHWADQATLLLLQHLARRLPEAPLLVAATCRTTEVDRSRPFTDVLARLHRERLCEQLPVGPFSEEEARTLIGRLADARPASPLVADVHRRTGGNPFFLEEVVRHLTSEGRDLANGQTLPADWVVPETVRQVIGSRLSRLRPEAMRVLQVAATLGDPFSFEALAAAAGAEPDQLLDALDEVAAHEFVREGATGDYHFSHALVRETVYAGLSAPRRTLLHADVAERLEALHQPKAAVTAGELAHHFLLGGRRGGLPKAMGYALQAAERATAQKAFEEAVRYYRMALDAHERSGELDEARRCEMLLALAAATIRAGEWQRGDEINLDAAETARTAGLTDLLVRACLATATAANPIENARLIPALEAALAATPGSDSARRSGLLSLLAYQRSKAESWERAASVREEGIAMARRLGDARALAFALRNAYLGRSFTDMGSLEEHLHAVEEVVELARELGDKELEVTSQCDHLQGSLFLGDIAAVDSGIEAHVRLGDELQQRVQVMHALTLRAMRALLSGPLSRAEQLHRELGSAGRKYNAPWTAPSIAALSPSTLILRWEQGRLAELQAPHRAALQRPQSPLAGMIRPQLAFICSELGDEAEARALVEQLGKDRFTAIPLDYNRLFVISLLSQACSSLGDVTHADMLYDFIRPHAAHVVTPDNAPVCLGSASRYLGMLATTLHRFDDAERHFGDSDAMNTRLGARPLLAHTKVDRARLHLARHARGDIARARKLLEEAAIAFDGLEIPYHAGKARELLESLLQGQPARATYPGGLSEREVEVLRLVASGRSSKEIGDELVLSVRTVERHIANIYLKTGTHGRVEAASYAHAHGLASSGS